MIHISCTAASQQKNIQRHPPRIVIPSIAIFDYNKNIMMKIQKGQQILKYRRETGEIMVTK